jgi:hypothetical protein
MKTSRSLSVLVAVSLSLATLGATSGCIAVAAAAGAAGAVAYVRGELASNLSADLERAQNATDRAIGQLGFAKVSDRRDATAGVFLARTAADKKIEINLEKVGDKMTKIRIRVGLIGDEALSLQILDKVKANL